MSSETELLGQLRSVYLFQALSDKELSNLAKKARRVPHQAGREIVEEGGGAAGFHLILSGTADVSVHGEHRRELGPGDYFGEISLIDGKPRSASVTAKSDMETLSIVAWDFAPLLDENPKLARGLLLGLCERVRQIESA